MKTYRIKNVITGLDRYFEANHVNDVWKSPGELITHETEEYEDDDSDLSKKMARIFNPFNPGVDNFIHPPHDEKYLSFMEEIEEMKGKSKRRRIEVKDEQSDPYLEDERPSILPPKYFFTSQDFNNIYGSPGLGKTTTTTEISDYEKLKGTSKKEKEEIKERIEKKLEELKNRVKYTWDDLQELGYNDSKNSIK